MSYENQVYSFFWVQVQFQKNFDLKLQVVRTFELSNSYKSNPGDWRKYAKFDKYKYTRNLVHEGNGKFNLMLLCWAPGNQSSIHDHANAHCFVKVLDGSLREVCYKDLSRVKAGFKSVPLQPYFEFPTTFWHWLAQRFQNKIGEECF